MSNADPPRSLAARYRRFLSRHAVWVLAASVLAFLGAAALARRLELRTSVVELLPSHDPGVLALEKTQERMGGDISLLLIGVQSPDRDANLRYADALTRKLQALPKGVVELAAYNVRDVKAFFEKHKWLYLPEADLEAIRDRLRREIGKRKNPLLVDLSDDDESLDAMRARITAKDRMGERFPGGVFTSKDGDYVWVAALAPGGILVERAGDGLLIAAKKIVAEDDPRRTHPEMSVYFGGPVATANANREAVERDIMWVTLTCLVLVAFSIALYFRRLRSVPLIGLPAVLGTVMAFAVADLAFGYLNSSTAFLGSIILGNGINYAIILMSRYQEHRAAGDGLDESLEKALAGVMRGTAVAAVCASCAYASLMLTSFRGFFQFGVMGAVGVLFCWLATFTVLPALLVVMDRRTRSHHARRAPLQLGFLGGLLGGRRSLIALLVGSTGLTVAAFTGLAYFLEAPFEYDFRKLRAQLNTTPEGHAFDDQTDGLFGRWPSPTVILADDVKETETLRQAIRKQDQAQPGNDVIGQIVTAYDLLPGLPEVQQRKLGLLAQIRKLVADPALEALDEKERKQIAAVDPPAEPRALRPMDLPALARRPFTELDGTVGRVLLVYPVEKGLSVWDGRALLRIASVLREIKLDNPPKTVETSGNAVIFGAMLRSILRDGPRATAASLTVVVLLCLFIMRPLSAALRTILALVMGVLWMVGAAGLGEVKITFLNFIALPITFGIGAEYALNVVARQQQGGGVIAAVMSTGSAVALCSWTTIVGYGSLLAARNRALQGFGAMAILGEVACLAAALVALPAIELWRQQWLARRRASRA